MGRKKEQKINIKQLPTLERPYEKLELYGESALSEAELLAIIIKTGTKTKTSVQLAQELLAANKDEQKQSLEFLKELTIEELKKIKGIGRIKAIQIKAACELATRMAKPADYRKITIRKPYDLAKILLPEMKYEKIEKIKIVVLNSVNQILKIKDVATGSTSFANVELKDIFCEPVKMQAPKIILVHNHPSGDPTPSRTDFEFTKNVQNVANSLGIQLLDHIVIGNMNYKSIFSEMTKSF